MNFLRFYPAGWPLFLVFVLLPWAGMTQDFSANITEGCSPLVVNFTSNAPGAVSYSWNLSNNTFSTLANPAVTYTTGGFFNVSVTVSYANGTTQTITKNAYIEVFTPPTAAFTAAPLAMCAGTEVTFTSQSTQGSGPITGWQWDFGDGTTNATQAPKHTYGQAGNFAITLVVTDVNGCTNLLQKPTYLLINPSPLADFTANNTLSCTTPFNVNFLTLSPVPATAHFWSFGNGGTAITSNPSTTYNAIGSYTVTHIVSDPVGGCADTVTKVNYIQVGSPNIAFQVSKSTACVGEAIAFSCGAAPGSAVSWNFGNGTSNQCSVVRNYTTPGTYNVTITITDPSGCTYTASQPIVIHPLPTVSFTVSDTLLCEAPHVVTFTSTGSAGTTYAWNFGDGTTGTGPANTHTYPTLPINTSSGQPYLWDVSLTVTNNFGCTSSLSKNGYVNTGQTQADLLANSRLGCAPRNVLFTDISTSNSPVVSWQWDFGVPGGTSTAQNPNFTYQDTGYYDITLIIETLHGCRDTLFLPNYVAAGDTPVANFIPDTTYACASNAIEFTNLSLNADSSRWIFGDGGSISAFEPTYQFVDTGFMSVMLIAFDRGCPDTMFVDSLIYIDPPIARFQPLNAFGCELPFTVDFTDFSIGAQTWSWDFGDGSPLSSVQNPTHIYTQEGNFITELIIQNLTTGCADTLGGVVRVELVEASFDIDTTFGCKPLVVAFDDLSYKAISWFWQFGDGSTSNQPEPGHAYTAPGFYDVSLFVSNSIGCSDDTMITELVKVYEPQVSFAAAPQQGCAPLSVTFTNNTISLAPVVSWQWVFGPPGLTSTAQSPTQVFTTPGSWNVSLVAVDSIGCTNSLLKNGEVFVSSPIPNFITAHPINCPNNPMVFVNASTGSGLTYLWDFGDGTTSAALNPTKTYTTPGSYTVSLTVTDFQGCDSTLVVPGFVTIANPVISLSADSTNAECPPLLVNFTGNALSPHPFTTWSWNFGNGSTSAGQNPSHIYINPGNYTVDVTATTAAGCSATFSAPNLITINGPTGSFTIAPTAACPGVPLTFTATSSNSTIFTWDFNNGALGSGQTTTYAYPAPGIYLPLLILEDSVGCVIVVPNSQPVNIHPVPNLSFTQNLSVLCDSGTVQFTNTSVSTAPITGTFWSFGLGLGTSTQNSPSFTFNQPGQYSVRLIMENNFGCRDTLLKPALITVGTSPDARMAFSDTTGCAPFTVTFLNQSLPGSSPLVNRTWTFLTNPLSTSGQAQPTFTYNQPGLYFPILRVTDQNGCSDSDTLGLEALTPPVANFAADDSFGCAPKAVQFQTLTPNIVDWEWNFGDGTPTVFIDDPLHTYFADGTYSVSLAVTDVEGCKDTLLKPQYIRLDHPTANFSVSDTVICPGETLQFTDLSQSDTLLTGWNWQFGNGSTSSQANPGFAYTASGLYAVSLRVTDVFGCEDSLTKPRYVRVRLDETPTPPPIYAVTVLSNSEVRISYGRYRNENNDFGEYRLYRRDATGLWTLLKATSFINDTSFTDIGLSTQNEPYCYRLEVRNHCDRPSELREDLVHCTILLETQSLVDAIGLSWSPYAGWPVERYRVYRVNDYADPAPLLMVELPGNQTTWVDEDMFCYDAHIYRVEAIRANSEWRSWSNIRREAPQHFGPPFPLEMVVATVEQDREIRVVWNDLPPGENLVQVIVEKDAGNGFQAWHAQPINDPQREKIDTDVDVYLRPYAYQAFLVDTCGDVTPAGLIARSIHLTAERAQGEIALIWTPYDQWESGVERYEIELLDESTGQFNLLATVGGAVTTFTDDGETLAQGTYCYRIRAVERGGARSQSLSNQACVTLDPLLYFPSAFSPNGDGQNEVFLIKGAYLAQFSLEIYNRWGEMIYSTTDLSQGWDGSARGKISPEGVYVFKVVANGFEGEVIRRTGTVTLFR